MSKSKKKLSGVNPKAQEARDRKAAQKVQVQAQKAKEEADRRWSDDGVVHENAKAAARRKEAEAKKQAKADREAQKRALEAEEAAAIGKPQPHAKITQAKIQAMNERQKRLEAEERAKQRAAAGNKKEVVDLQPVVLENLNLKSAEALAADEEKFGAENVIVASGVNEALAAMSVDGADRHPEKRAKALHRKFEETYLPLLKQEHPGLRLSQYKEMLWKMWQKSEENPRNQPQE